VTQNQVLYMAREAVGAVLLVGGPVLGVSLLVGLLVSIFQSMTQIQEQTLTFIPKVIAVAVVMLVLGLHIQFVNPVGNLRRHVKSRFEVRGSRFEVRGSRFEVRYSIFEPKAENLGFEP